MRFGSVCSGIEAASVAWHPLGWKAAWLAEIEPFPSAVLKHHYPDVPNYGDMTKFKDWPDEPIDLLCGGTPCQSFSVAGLRKGLDDPRGNLMLTYLAIAAKYRPKWLVWENVPGVLSSNGGRDFASFLHGMGECGYGFAYRVLDAQYFGVAQRRRRVFVVGCLGDWRSAAAVLFERDSLQGNPAPSREKRQGVTHATAPCLTSSGRGVERTGDTRGQDPVVAVAFGGNNQSGSIDIATTRLAHNSATGRMDFGSETFLVIPTIGGHFSCDPIPINTQIATRHKAMGLRTGLGVGDSGDPAYTLIKGHCHAVATTQYGTIAESLTARHDSSPCADCGMNVIAFHHNAQADQLPNAGKDTSVSDSLTCSQQAAVALPIAFSAKDHGADATEDLSPTLRAMPHHGSHANGGGQIAVMALDYEYNAHGVDEATGPLLKGSPSGGGHPLPAVMAVFLQDDTTPKTQIESANTLRREAGGEGACVFAQMAVRRLTPTECERLQGFPDGYTNIPWRGKPESPDGPRYKALGNSWAVPCARWIGERIQLVDDLKS